ncbi:MAG: hypothetical protein RMM17_02035 [Acidobacteriota bacterium]|nr:hypothetical protein [Blastocatellia bacterium]MDW8411450.1 hypothetical protein [Acidobacteriota bacterium]
MLDKLSVCASQRGRVDTKIIPLKFVRIDPYILSEKNLTRDDTERVDIRMLQVITLPSFPVYVGQQVDVFIDLGEPSVQAQ